jgi:hypothetical protein
MQFTDCFPGLIRGKLFVGMTNSKGTIIAIRLLVLSIEPFVPRDNGPDPVSISKKI